MKIVIDMVDVKDGDSIVVCLEDGVKSIVMLIDAGNSQFSEKVISALDLKLAEHKKAGPDVVVVTHYDSDHIGGILSVLNKYQANVGSLWIHDPAFTITTPLQTMLLESKILARETNVAVKEKMRVVIESVNELKTVISRAGELGIKMKQPFAGECYLDGWPAVKVLGPTKEYYRSIFDNILTDEAFIAAESEQWLLTESAQRPAVSLRPCEQLPTTSRITPTNKGSVVLGIDLDGKKYLFTGDAGIESFLAIPNYRTELENLYWLKAPHHGSVNNLSSALIQLMKPQHVYISGDKYFDQCVKDCFESKGSAVKVTKEDGNLEFSSQTERFKEMLRGM